MTDTAGTDPLDYCRHRLPIDNCAICRPPWQWWSVPMPSVAAGHCGKCGAPYTMDMTAGIGPPKFIPSCKCWNL